MKKVFCKTVFFFAAFLLAGCTSLQKGQTERSIAAYEKELLPFIIEQINNTAETFFYDLEKLNRSLKEKRKTLKEGPIGNVIVGNNEIGGVCRDYASHFIDNYKGPGEVYYLRVDDNGEAAFLQRRVKPFEKNDIIINDAKTVETFIEETYQWVISNTKEEVLYIIEDKEKRQWSTFYIYTTNGMTYWTEDKSDYTSILFTKDLIRINMTNYQVERDRQKEKHINDIYSDIIQLHKDKKEFASWWYGYEAEGWHIETLSFHTNKDGELFLIEETPIPTPKFHAGKTEEEKKDFFDHAWVRIIWEGRTFDVDPTWYDNGFGGKAIGEITPNKITDYNVSRVEGPSERNNPPKTDAGRITAAIRWGDCAFLSNYTKREDADRRLRARANDAIKRYTDPDNGTAKYRTRKMETRIRDVSKEDMERVFVEPETVLPKVVSSLMRGISDPFLKTKILHDWICDNIALDTEMYFSGKITAQDYVSVLKKKKAVCSGYTELYNKMCTLAGIESIGINGYHYYDKGNGDSAKLGIDTNHAWNAVYLVDKWYLADVTLDAGIIAGETFVKQYSTEWFFIEPRSFLYSHLPEDEAYQYYAPVLTPDDFIREAYIPGKFFQYGFSLKGKNPEYTNRINGEFSFDLVLHNNIVQYSSELQTPQQQYIDATTFTERNGATITFYFDVPDTERYKGHIFALDSNVEKLKYRIDIETYEKRVEALYEDLRITEKELEYFKKAYDNKVKVMDKDWYYLLEDQFDIPRNAAVLKIHKLLDISTTTHEHILGFNIQAGSEYPGFGKGVLKYPYTYPKYSQLSNTKLIFPRTGTLKSGSSQTFVISSKDYLKFFIIINGKWKYFDNKTGNYEVSLTVPENIENLFIDGVNNSGGKNSLIRYKVVTE